MTELTRLLRIWARSRDARVAHLVRELDAGLPRNAPSGRSRAAHEEWLSRVAEGEPRDVGALLDTLPSGTSVQAAERLERLATHHPADPRIPDAILGWVAAPPFVTPPHANVFWRQAWRVLAAQAPPSFSEEKGALADHLQAKHLRGYAADRIPGGLRRLKLEPFAPRALTDEDEALLQGQLALHPMPQLAEPPREKKELLEAIRSDPTDMGLRMVLSDVLQEHGDPMGEYIVREVQQAGSGEALLREHAEEWLGPWLPIVADVTMFCGFPHAVRLHRNFERLPKLSKEERMRTVRKMTLRRARLAKRERALIRLLKSPVLANLVHVERLWPDDLVEIAKKRRGLEHIGLELRGNIAQLSEVLGTFASLHTVDLGPIDRAAEASPATTRRLLEELSIAHVMLGSNAPVRDVVGLLPGARAITLDTRGHVELELTRVDGELVAASLTSKRPDLPVDAAVLDALTGLDLAVDEGATPELKARVAERS